MNLRPSGYECRNAILFCFNLIQNVRIYQGLQVFCSVVLWSVLGCFGVYKHQINTKQTQTILKRLLLSLFFAFSELFVVGTHVLTVAG